MTIDGRCCSGAELVELLAAVRPVVEAMDAAVETVAGETGPTFFEITTSMALLYFARRKVDAAVLEVGLGGRLDATNVCQPQVSVITSISLDHTQQLGNTLESIALEKAGIVKPGVPVISGVVPEVPRETIRQISHQRGCRLVELGVDFDFRYRPPHHLERGPEAGSLDFCCRFGSRQGAIDNLSLNLLGEHQAANAAVALATLAELQQAGWKIPETAIRSGLSAVTWPARIEVIGRNPVVVLDAAHNLASAEALVRTLDESFSVDRRLLIFAVSQDKDLRGLLGALLSHFDHVALTQFSNNPRAVPADQLQALALELFGRPYAGYSTTTAAWNAIRSLATPNDLICITGSFFLAAELRSLAIGGKTA
jgi:dihydrofolate synthase / folylpolyglutamate synthase